MTTNASAKSAKVNYGDSLSVKPSELITILAAFYKNRRPKPIVLGSPGCGKTNICYQLADNVLKIPRYTFQATLYDPVEIKGLPVFDHTNNIARFIPFEDMPSMDEGLLIVDDLPHAPSQTQNALMRLILEGVAGAWNLGGLFPIATGNRATDRAGAKDLQTAMANRFCFLNLTVDHEEWRRWAINHNLAPQVVGYLSSPVGRDWLDRFDSNSQINATPRSWEAASDCFKVLTGNTLRLSLYGCIGQEAASKLLGWLKYYEKMPDLAKIIAGKNLYPEELDVMYATVTSLVTIAKSVEKKATIYQRLLDYCVNIPDKFVELGVILSKDLIDIDTEAFGNCNIDAWTEKYPDLVDF